MLQQYLSGIAAEARSHLGAHYIWGAGGNHPGSSGGLPTLDSHTHRPLYAHRLQMNPDVTDPRNPYLFAATCNSGTVHTCNGRDFHEDLIGRQRVELSTLSNPAGLRSAMQNPYSWLWPRVNGEPLEGPRIVWGEPCMGRAHFDCISFINYCIWRVAGAVHSPSIRAIMQWWQRRYAAGPSPFHLPYQTGDIIVGPGDHHIVFVIGGEMIHAKGTHWGVVHEPIDVPAGAIVVRPTEEFLVGIYR